MQTSAQPIKIQFDKSSGQDTYYSVYEGAEDWWQFLVRLAQRGLHGHGGGAAGAHEGGIPGEADLKHEKKIG